MIYLFKTYDLAEFRDFNLFQAIERITGDETGKWETFNDMESLEDYVIDDFNQAGDYFEAIDTNSYLVIVDLDNQTISKKIYKLKLESKVIASDGEIQKLLDKENKIKEEREKELAAAYEKIKDPPNERC